jgi:hypothetical protein
VNPRHFVVIVLFTATLSVIADVPAQDVMKRLTKFYPKMSTFGFSMFVLNPGKR